MDPCKIFFENNKTYTQYAPTFRQLLNHYNTTNPLLIFQNWQETQALIANSPAKKKHVRSLYDKMKKQGLIPDNLILDTFQHPPTILQIIPSSPEQDDTSSVESYSSGDDDAVEEATKTSQQEETTQQFLTTLEARITRLEEESKNQRKEILNLMHNTVPRQWLQEYLNKMAESLTISNPPLS